MRFIDYICTLDFVFIICLMEEENVAIRLKFFMDNMGISNSQFADSCGIPRPTVSQLLNGRNKKISDVIIGMIHKSYPELSIMWLLFGEGEMCLTKEDNENSGCAVDAALSDVDNLSDIQMFDDADEYVRRTNDSVAFKQPVSRFNESPVPCKVVPEKIRKVVSITVFYDDNSYETFESASKSVSDK